MATEGSPNGDKDKNQMGSVVQNVSNKGEILPLFIKVIIKVKQ